MSYALPDLDSQSEAWRSDAACAGHDQPQLWDNHVDDESVAQRRSRLAAARAICADCSVSAACLAAADPRLDEGLRGGKLLGHVRPGRTPAPCGTESGYNRHRRAKEQPCTPCTEASRQAQRRRKEGAARSRRVAACGTNAGYQRHKRAGETPCTDCVTAKRTYARDYQRQQRKAARVVTS